MNPPLPTTDAWLAHRGRFVNVDFMVQCGERETLIRIHEGRIENVRTGPLVMPRWTFRLSASSDAWRMYFAPQPTPGYHDLMAMIKFRTLRLEGDQHIFMSNLLYFKDLIQTLGGTVQ